MAYTTNNKIHTDNILTFLDSISKSLNIICEFITENKFKQCNTMTREDVARCCNCSTERVAEWHNLGMLKGIKTGKHFVYLPQDVQKLQEEYKGFDISNHSRSKESKQGLKKPNNTHIDI